VVESGSPFKREKKESEREREREDEEEDIGRVNQIWAKGQKSTSCFFFFFFFFGERKSYAFCAP